MLETENTTSYDIPSQMKAVVVTDPNQEMHLSEVMLPIPECNENELLVKVEYVGLNPVDGLFAQTGFCQWQFPHILGLDAVGVVVKAAKGVFPNVGDRVMWHASIGDQGVLSEYAAVANFAVSVVPENLDAITAAALPCAGMTALIALESLRLSEGETVLIEAGAGAVGQFAIQFAKQRGAIVFSTASKRNHKLLKQLGADAVFDYRDEKLCEKINRELGPQGFDAVIDSIGGDNTIRNIELMHFCGRIACLKPLPQFDQELMFRKGPTISIISLCGAWLSKSLCAQQKMSFMSNLLLENVAKGTIETPQISTLDFSASTVSEALTRQLSGSFTGKQIVKINTNH